MEIKLAMRPRWFVIERHMTFDELAREALVKIRKTGCNAAMVDAEIAWPKVVRLHILRVSYKRRDDRSPLAKFFMVALPEREGAGTWRAKITLEDRRFWNGPLDGIVIREMSTRGHVTAQSALDGLKGRIGCDCERWGLLKVPSYDIKFISYPATVGCGMCCSTEQALLEPGRPATKAIIYDTDAAIKSIIEPLECSLNGLPVDVKANAKEKSK